MTDATVVAAVFCVFMFQTFSLAMDHYRWLLYRAIASVLFLCTVGERPDGLQILGQFFVVIEVVSYYYILDCPLKRSW